MITWNTYVHWFFRCRSSVSLLKLIKYHDFFVVFYFILGGYTSIQQYLWKKLVGNIYCHIKCKANSVYIWAEHRMCWKPDEFIFFVFFFEDLYVICNKWVAKISDIGASICKTMNSIGLMNSQFHFFFCILKSESNIPNEKIYSFCMAKSKKKTLYVDFGFSLSQYHAHLYIIILKSCISISF